MNYSAAARRGLARHGGRPGLRVPRRHCRGDFPNFPWSASRTRSPRGRRPRPCAPAALPPLPPILCLLSRSWHLSQRARFPAHPFAAAGSGRGRGRGTRRRGAGGGARRLPALGRRTAPGAAAMPARPGTLFRGEVMAAAAPGIPRSRPRPRAVLRRQDEEVWAKGTPPTR
ncbi:translation initiation factor IF-2-like [Elephas maximus indicus]|uniref:translation initiation factor IF-2-like n=1 Tax=Elephas maximus indicus TaxID=99487 RepID=UPI002115CEA0|nr:translation initiation factor IF-2-like [Elephas maximus indicus]